MQLLIYNFMVFSLIFIILLKILSALVLQRWFLIATPDTSNNFVTLIDISFLKVVRLIAVFCDHL